MHDIVGWPDAMIDECIHLRKYVATYVLLITLILMHFDVITIISTVLSVRTNNSAAYMNRLMVRILEICTNMS